MRWCCHGAWAMKRVGLEDCSGQGSSGRRGHPCCKGPFPLPRVLCPLGSSIPSFGQAHPALPPWLCPGLLPASCTVDMAGPRELPLGGSLRTRLGKGPYVPAEDSGPRHEWATGRGSHGGGAILGWGSLEGTGQGWKQNAASQSCPAMRILRF